MIGLLIWATGFVICGCATQSSDSVYTKEGKEFGKVKGAFRHRWWNYYERGMSFADGEFHQEAGADFKIAIAQRPEDERRARTYGMHFVDYFPHRELGVVYYRMGDLKAAKAELELSLSQYPSSKARFYLDRVRKALIEQQAREVAPPKLYLDEKAEEIWTRDDPVLVSGYAEDEEYVASLSVKGVPVFLEGAEQKVAFKQALELSQGRHEVPVVARNLAGKAATRRLVVRVDREGPVITVEKVEHPQRPMEGEIFVSGSAYDEAGVFQLVVNGTVFGAGIGTEVPFTQRLPLGTKDLDITARDRLGNETSARIPLPHPSTARPLIRLASADPAPFPVVLAASGSAKDTRPPEIKLRGWTESQTVFLDKAYIEGQAMDESMIEGLTINRTSILRRKGQSIFFSHLAELKEGENTLVIEARDEAGNTGTKTIIVVKQVPKALHLAERMSMTVLPFEQNGVASEAGLSFQDRLIDSLVDQNRFRVVERNKLDVILQEQKLSRTELIDKSTALKLGKLVAAQSVLTGGIVETRAGTEIVARLIDTETSEILATEDVYDEVKDLIGLKSLAEGMAIKFHRDFPLLQGMVVQQKGNAIFTDLGQDQVKLQSRLIVYREEAVKHPVSGKVLGADHVIVGRAKVTQVLPEMSKADIVDGKAETIKPMDKVITE
jgi:TolB-like protein